MPGFAPGDYQRLDGLAIAEGIRARHFSALEIIDAALARAEAVNPRLNAISWPTFEQARTLAARIDNDKSLHQLPFAGVPFLFKDISAVKGLPQTGQSRLFDGVIANHDAAMIKAFRHSGVIALGKTNTPELCLTITTESVYGGPCRNPWHTGKSTGGSSGGSAAAVAAGIVPLAHATDGGGSIRIPAACCGVVGLKPSRGLTPVEPDMASSWSGMSVGHVVSRTVRDSAAMLDAIRLRAPFLFPLPPGPERYSAAPGPTPPARIALHASHPAGADIHPEVSRALEITAELLEAQGHRVEEQVPPVNYEALADKTSRIIFLHVAQSIMPRLEALGLAIDTPLIEEVTRRMAARGAKLSALDYVEALDWIHQLALEMASFHQTWDAVLSPVLSQPPAPLGWLDMNSSDIRTYAERFSRYSGFCSLYNATGQPSISIPVHQTADGLPIGIMLSANWGNDRLLLNLAQQLEDMIGWQNKRPPI